MYDDDLLADSDLLEDWDFDGEAEFDDWSDADIFDAGAFDDSAEDLYDDFDDAVDDLFNDDFDDAVDDLFDDDFDDLFDDALDDDLDLTREAGLADAVSGILGSLSSAESFNFTKAIGQIGKSAGQALDDPTVRQIAGTALPIAGGAAGTAIGGPVGTVVGTSLGAAAGKALAPAPAPAPAPPTPAPVPATRPTAAPSPPAPARPPTTGSIAVPPPAPPKPAVASGSDAAKQALVLSQQPEVLTALLALALGERGSNSVNGVPVGAVMNMLSTIFARASADSDELLYTKDRSTSYLLDAEGFLQADPAAPGDRADALYAALVG